jgi:hypothetical protein
MHDILLSLFNDAVSTAPVTSVGWEGDGKLIGKNVKGKSRGLFKITIPQLLGGTSLNPKNKCI